MTDEMKPVSTQDLRAVALYLTTGGARAGSFEFDTEDGRRVRLSAKEIGGPFDEVLSAPSSPGDGWETGWLIENYGSKHNIYRAEWLTADIYTHADALASRDAEIERLRGELRRAHLKRLVELSEEFGGYDELSTSALSALKTAREGNNA